MIAHDIIDHLELYIIWPRLFL